MNKHLFAVNMHMLMEKEPHIYHYNVNKINIGLYKINMLWLIMVKTSHLIFDYCLRH